MRCGVLRCGVLRCAAPRCAALRCAALRYAALLCAALRSVALRKLRTKMILTPDDVKERYAWAEKYKDKSKGWWLKTAHVHLDNHHMPMALII